MSDLLQSFARQLFGPCGVNPGDRLLLAVSGGCDSLALLYLCHQLAEDHQLYLCVAHLNHELRAEAVHEQDFVKDQARQLQLDFTSESLPVAEMAALAKAGVEEKARELRYRFLRQAAQLKNCGSILLGHHRGDQAETVLQRLVRGAGPDGLAGMAPRHDDLVRPLLPFSRSELEAYLRQLGLSWCEDPSNADHRLTRNRLRHRVLPELNKINPRVERTLALQAERMRRDADFWQGLVADAFNRCCVSRLEAVIVDLGPYAQLHPSLQVRLLHSVLERVRQSRRGIGSGHLQSLRDMALGGRSQADLDLPQCWSGRRYGELWVAKKKPESVSPFSIPLPDPGRYTLPGGGALILTQGLADEDPGPFSVWLSLPQHPFHLWARTVRPGDSFRPEGLNGAQRLKNFLINRKVVREVRAELPLLVSDAIVWVAGFMVAEGWRARPGEEALKVEYRPPEKWSFRL